MPRESRNKSNRTGMIRFTLRCNWRSLTLIKKEQ